MAAIKRYLDDKINDLARRSGYDSEFLWEMWLQVEDGDWNYFQAVTMERDW